MLVYTLQKYVLWRRECGHKAPPHPQIRSCLQLIAARRGEIRFFFPNGVTLAESTTLQEEVASTRWTLGLCVCFCWGGFSFVLGGLFCSGLSFFLKDTERKHGVEWVGKDISMCV